MTDTLLPLTRHERGQKIVHTRGSIRRLDARTYTVQSQTGVGRYLVVATEAGWKCECPDHSHRRVKCKHIWAVEFSIELRKEVQGQVTVISEKALACRYCDSESIVKKAKRYNKYGAIQRYLCKDCGKRFSFNIGFERMHATPQIITTAMQLYFTGESFRNVQKFIALQGLSITHQTVYNWIKRYVALMEGYLEKIVPNVSDTWRTDELYLKIKGDTKYLYALMDDQTRFWIAQQVAESKYYQDVTPLFREAKKIACKLPRELVSDGATNFHVAWKKEYRTMAGPRTKHIRHVHLQGDMNNNKMERMNGEVRDREKVMRGIKKMTTPILPGYQLYHNYIREHEGLEGKTPAEVAGIKIEGQNKWITIIQNARTALGRS